MPDASAGSGAAPGSARRRGGRRRSSAQGGADDAAAGPSARAAQVSYTTRTFLKVVFPSVVQQELPQHACAGAVTSDPIHIMKGITIPGFTRVNVMLSHGATNERHGPYRLRSLIAPTAKAQRALHGRSDDGHRAALRTAYAPPQGAAGLSAGQVTAVGMLVADMFTEPNAEKRFTLAQVVERAGHKGLRFSSGQIGEVRAAGAHGQ